MAGPKKNTPADDLMASLLKEVGMDSANESEDLAPVEEVEQLDLNSSSFNKKPQAEAEASTSVNPFLGGPSIFDDKTDVEYEKTRHHEVTEKTEIDVSSESSLLDLKNEQVINKEPQFNLPPEQAEEQPEESLFKGPEAAPAATTQVLTSDQTKGLSDNNKTVAQERPEIQRHAPQDYNPNERTVAVTGFHKKPTEDYEDKVKVSIGQNRAAYSPGYAAWGGGADSSLGQAENLRMAQEKILDLEKENELLRVQNEELISASDIIKERSDLLTAQVSEYQNDKEGLEESFKNEIALLKGHLQRKDVEHQKALLKIDDLDSRLKFDMKKIRIRERELENRLELIRAEKNALTKSKDDQILDLRRKMDVLQMEVESYRQKCVDLNKTLEVNQDSFKRTTRALRLAMANLELQEENKPSLKKVD